jgi:hypothetical protein
MNQPVLKPIPPPLPPRPVPAGQVKAWITGGIVGFLLASCMGTCMTAGWWLASHTRPDGKLVVGKDRGLTGGSPVIAKTWTREEFRKEFLGKTLSEVRERLGAPDPGDYTSINAWCFKSRVVDPKTGKATMHAILQHKDDRVFEIAFWTDSSDRRGR